MRPRKSFAGNFWENDLKLCYLSILYHLFLCGISLCRQLSWSPLLHSIRLLHLFFCCQALVMFDRDGTFIEISFQFNIHDEFRSLGRLDIWNLFWPRNEQKTSIINTNTIYCMEKANNQIQTIGSVILFLCSAKALM